MADPARDPSTAFLERLAHDLRGPLSPLQTAAYLLRRGNVDAARQDELLEIIDRQTTRLSAMVQEVSDWMRAGQERLVGHRESIEVPMLVELACAPRAARVAQVVSPSLDQRTVNGDTQRLVQMLATLLDFMGARASPGPVNLSAQPAGERVLIEIEAAGSRWDDAERGALFNRAQDAPFDEGLGMRLMIASAIARGHDGDVTVCDSPQGWATVRVSLPFLD